MSDNVLKVAGVIGTVAAGAALGVLAAWGIILLIEQLSGHPWPGAVQGLCMAIAGILGAAVGVMPDDD